MVLMGKLNGREGDKLIALSSRSDPKPCCFQMSKIPHLILSNKNPTFPNFPEIKLSIFIANFIAVICLIKSISSPLSVYKSITYELNRQQSAPAKILANRCRGRVHLTRDLTC